VTELAESHWRALSLSLYLKDRPLPRGYDLILYAFHLLGLLAVVRLTHQVLWLALVPVLLIQPVVIFLRQRKPHPLAESLAPLFIAYTVLALRLLIALVARVQGLTSGSLLVPEPWGRMLNLNIATGLCAAWTLMAQAGPTTEAFGRRAGWARILGTTLTLLTLVWAGVAYLAVRTQGVTGSDPYAYVQMALDIAGHGTPLHTFPLTPRVAGWGLPVWPVVPVGYVPPDPGTGVAATVWPPGYSAALAVSYMLGGEAGLYILTPLLGLVALLAVWRLSLDVLPALKIAACSNDLSRHYELFSSFVVPRRGVATALKIAACSNDLSRHYELFSSFVVPRRGVATTWADGWRFLAAGITVFVLATSYEQVDRLSVPLADIPAQLLSILAVFFALRATRGRTLLYASLTGVCLGVAFAVRYTQVLLAICILFLWVFHFSQGRPPLWRRIALSVACFGITAWLVASPILGYHQAAFGGPFRVGGTAELALFGWEHIPRTLMATLRDFLIPKEFLYLAPFALWGAIQVWRGARYAAIALLTWLAVIVVFHLPYPALRLRDLLSVLPVLAIWTGVGMADVLSQVQRIRPSVWRKGAQVLALGLMIAALWARSQVVLWLPVHARDFQSFGYLRAEQRAAFDTLAALVPAEGIVAASLNGGAIILYTGRDIVRPAYWSADDWLDFVAQALNEKRRVYLLVDGVEMGEPLEMVQSHYQVNLIGSLPVPYFYPGGNSENRDVPLYEVVKTKMNVTTQPSAREG
jgi:hypothetical protein